MFDLLSPLFLYVGGAVAALVPLLLHLLQSRRTVRTPFSTVRFLKLAQEKSSRQIKMENILLWIIRTLLLFTLALAFAMPMLRSKSFGKWFGRSPRDVAIVLDGSYSMEYNLGRSTVWDNAIDAAVSIVDGLEERDKVCIFVARDRVDPVMEQLNGDHEQAVSALRALKPSQTSSQLAPAVMDANAALKEAKGQHEREIYVITDTQALPWKGFGGETAADGGAPAAATAAAAAPAGATADKESDGGGEDGEEPQAAAIGAWDPSQIEKRTAIFVSMLGVGAPENLAPVEVKIEPGLILADELSKATVRFRNTGPSKASKATLFVDAKEVSSRTFTAGSEHGGELVFAIPPLRAGWHSARIEVPEDNLPVDNAFQVVLKAEDQFPTLTVGSRDDTMFLRAALMAGHSGDKKKSQSDWVQPGALDADKLSAYTCVFLCNAIPLGANDVNILENFVEAGGVLVMFPGARGAATDYRAWSCLPGVPTGIAEVPLTRRKRALHWDEPEHPILQPLQLTGTTLSVTVRRQLMWEDKLDDKALRLVSLGGEDPFLLGRPKGRGFVLMFAVSADRSWSDFPLSPFYLPLVHQIVEFGAGVGTHPKFVWCTESLALNRCLPEATRTTTLTGDDGRVLTVRSTLADGQTVLHVEDLMTAGIYRMSLPDGGEPVPALAVNMRRDESDLDALPPAKIPELMQIKRVNVSRDKEELMTQIQESRVGRTFGEQLLWLALFLAALEFYYANLLLRERPNLARLFSFLFKSSSSGEAAT